jgi:putative hydrolase of HD superfamily
MKKMESITNLLFQAQMLKRVNRTGYRFMGFGKETVAEHSFIVTFIAFVMTKMAPGVNGLKLISMGLLHDLTEAMTGDLDSVQKRYVEADERKAVDDMVKNLFFGESISLLIEEFNAGETEESKLAQDADQLAFIIDLKVMKDIGHNPASEWLNFVTGRLQTKIGKKIAKSILETGWDSWWRKNVLDIA